MEAAQTPRPFAVVTGASSGIGLEQSPARLEKAEMHREMAEPGSGEKA